MSLQQSKSILARLMATENLHVVHTKGLKTASFDLAQRTLHCPIWQDMDGTLYDLLMGHEVGHATETPQEGWHDAVTGTSSPKFKSFLNVVEDARIERIQKRKYPGLRRSFHLGYKELMNRDFFGVAEHPEIINVMNIIDRINLHFKVGPFLNVPFTQEEKKFVDRIENIQKIGRAHV